MIALASDHAGFELKKEIAAFLDEKKLEYKDFGTFSSASCDYPLFALQAASAVAHGNCECGILICGTGIGMSIAANKIKGIRCALCADCFSAKFSKEHNNSNMLALGSRVTGAGLARLIVENWLNAKFEGGRHERRISQIADIENGKIE